MKGWKKCLLFVQLSAVLLTASFTGFLGKTQQVFAAHPYDTYCSSSVQPQNFENWLSFASQSGYYFQSGGTYYVFDKPASYLGNGWFQMGSNATTNMWYGSTKPIKFFKHTNGKYYANMSVNPSFNPRYDMRTFSGSYTPTTTQSQFKGSQPPLSQQGATAWSWTGQGAGRGVWSGVPSAYPTSNLQWTGGVSVGQGSEWWWEFGQTTGTASYSNPCKVYGNSTYDSSWDQLIAGSVTVSNKTFDNNEGCSRLDIGCLLSNTFATVTETLVSTSEAIIRGIAGLFTPDVDTLKYSFEQFSNSLLDTLGFLAYPFEWIIDTLDALYGGIVADGSWGTGFCAINEFDWGLPSGTFFGSYITIDYCSPLADKIADVSRILFPVLISYALIRTFKHKIDEVHQK